MRNGKVYQTEVYLTETNPTSDGVKTLANANMVCEPSTDTVEGRDDYEGIGKVMELGNMTISELIELLHEITNEIESRTMELSG